MRSNYKSANDNICKSFPHFFKSETNIQGFSDFTFSFRCKSPINGEKYVTLTKMKEIKLIKPHFKSMCEQLRDQQLDKIFKFALSFINQSKSGKNTNEHCYLSVSELMLSDNVSLAETRSFWREKLMQDQLMFALFTGNIWNLLKSSQPITYAESVHRPRDSKLIKTIIGKLFYNEDTRKQEH